MPKAISVIGDQIVVRTQKPADPVHYKNKRFGTFTALTVLFFCLTIMTSAAQAIITIGRPDFSLNITTPDFLFDRQDKLTLNDLERPEYYAAFARWNSQQLNLPSDTTIWLRLAINNMTDKPVSLILRANYNDAPPPDIFILPVHQQQVASTMFQSSLTSHQTQRLFSIAPGQISHAYLKIRSSHNPRLNLYLESPQRALNNNQRFLLLSGFLLGSNLLLVMFSISLFKQYQTEDFKILTMSATLVLLFQLSWLGMPTALWQAITIPRFAIEHSLTILAFATLAYLIRIILPSEKGSHTPIDRLIPLLITIDIAMAIFSMIAPSYYPDGIHQLVVSVNSITLTLIGIIRLYEGNNFASHWLAVCIPFTLIQLTTSLTLLHLLPFNSQTMESLLLLTALGTIFFLTQMRVAYANRLKETPASPTLSAKENTIDWSYLGHELRTPMNGILGMTELMSSTPLSNRQQDYLQTIQLSGHELLTLINQIVDVNKIAHGELSHPADTFDPDDLLHDCVERYSYKASQLGLELACWTDIDVPAQLQGDTARICRIINTLMSHAINNTEYGEILLTADLHPSSEQVGDIRNIIRFSIQTTDNGAGYTSATQSLNSFNLNKDEEIPGGLSLVRQIIQYLQGTTGTSRNGQGTIYWVNLPLASAPQSQPLPANPSERKTNFDRRRALVVDDNDTCRNILVQQIQKLGLHVEQARDATEAMALLRTEAALGRPFDVVFLDHHMPGINGMQLARRISDDNTFLNLVIVMLTGLSQLPDSTLLAQTRINRVLTKPASGKKLKEILQEELAEEETSA